MGGETRPLGQDHFSVICRLYETENELYDNNLKFWIQLVGRMILTGLFTVCLLTVSERDFSYKLFLGFSILFQSFILGLRLNMAYYENKDGNTWHTAYALSLKGVLVYPRTFLLFYAALFLAFSNNGRVHLIVTSMIMFYECYYIGELAGKNAYLSRKYTSLVEDFLVPLSLSIGSHLYRDLQLIQRKRLWSAFFLQNFAVIELLLFFSLMLKTLSGETNIYHTLVCGQLLFTRYTLDPFPKQVFKNIRARGRNLRKGVFQLVGVSK